jgi:hypothetical protein
MYPMVVVSRHDRHKIRVGDKSPCLKTLSLNLNELTETADIRARRTEDASWKRNVGDRRMILRLTLKLRSCKSRLGFLPSGTIIFAMELATIEMKKANIVEAFLGVVSILQRQEVREARRVLLGIKPPGKALDQWTQDEKDQAEIACSTFDTVGILLRRNIIDRKMVVAEWRDSIGKCWDMAQPIIKEYRNQRGNDYWDDLANLQAARNRAKKILELIKRYNPKAKSIQPPVSFSQPSILLQLHFIH